MSDEENKDDEAEKTKPADEIDLLKKDIKYREQLKASLKENEAFKIEAEKEKKQLSDKALNLESTANSFKDKYAQAELKAHAVAAGLTDLDAIKMMDTSSVTVDENGDVKGVEEVISAFKASKPYLFASDKKTSSSTNSTVPSGTATFVRDAMKFTDHEWDVERQRAIQNPRMFNI